MYFVLYLLYFHSSVFLLPTYGVRPSVATRVPFQNISEASITVLLLHLQYAMEYVLRCYFTGVKVKRTTPNGSVLIHSSRYVLYCTHSTRNALSGSGTCRNKCHYVLVYDKNEE
jgi:hypothetical protein